MVRPFISKRSTPGREVSRSGRGEQPHTDRSPQRHNGSARLRVTHQIVNHSPTTTVKAAPPTLTARPTNEMAVTELIRDRVPSGE